MEEELPQPKISGIEALLMVMLCILFDLADFFATFLDALFGAGELVKFFINVVASATLWLWATMKGVGAERTLAGALAEMIPLVNTLPLRTGAMIATIWLDWHPKQAEVAIQVSNIKNPKRSLGKKALAAQTAKTNQAA